MSAIGPAIISATGRASSRAALVGSYAMSYFCGGLSHDGLLFFVGPDSTGSIGLSVDDYGLLSAYWQVVFFTDPTTPITHTYDDWMVILLADSEINNDIVLAVDGGGALVYADGTEQSVLDRGLVYLQNRVPVEATVFNNLTELEFNSLTESEFNALT